MVLVKTNCFGIEVDLTATVEGAISGTITSHLKERCPYCDTRTCRNDCDGAQGNIENIVDDGELDRRVAANDVMDVIESMVLAHACAGLDINSPSYLSGIETAVESVANNF